MTLERAIFVPLHFIVYTDLNQVLRTLFSWYTTKCQIFSYSAAKTLELATFCLFFPPSWT
jgi:hypothetical protein